MDDFFENRASICKSPVPIRQRARDNNDTLECTLVLSCKLTGALRLPQFSPTLKREILQRCSLHMDIFRLSKIERATNAIRIMPLRIRTFI